MSAALDSVKPFDGTDFGQVGQGVVSQARALDKVIQPHWHYADIGACRGEMTDFLLPRMEKGYLFEPSSFNYAHLQNKYAHISDDKLVLNECAVSKYSGYINFSLNTNDSHTGNIEGTQRRRFIDNFQEQVVPVKTVTLDSYFKNKTINFIKVDVEGAEWDVLEGSRQIMSENSIVFQIEFHSHEDWYKREMLNEVGYHIYDLEFNKLEPTADRPYQAIISKEDF